MMELIILIIGKINQKKNLTFKDYCVKIGNIIVDITYDQI